MPVVQGTDQFDHTIDAAHYDAFFDTPTQVATPLYQTNSNSIKIPSNNQNVGVRKNITGSPTKGWMGWAFQADTLPTGNDVVVGELRDTGGSVARWYLDSSGDMYVVCAGGTPVHAGLGTIAPDTWYWFEMIYDVDDGTGTKKLYWRIDDSDMTTATGVSAASTISWSQLVSLVGNGACDWYCGLWKWGTAASTSDFLGEPSAGSVAPIAFLSGVGW